MSPHRVQVSVVNPVREAIVALDNGVVELSICMRAEGKLVPTLEACADYPQLGNSGLKTLISALKRNHTCKALDLRGNRIGGGSAVRKLARVLAGNDTLEKLDLSCNEVTSADVKAIAEALCCNDSLTELSLNSNKITDNGVEALGKALRSNKKLKVLHLSHNHIRDDGAEALAGALERAGSLKVVTLNFNSIRNRGAKKLLRALGENTNLLHLGLSGNKINLRGAKYCEELFDSREKSGARSWLTVTIDHNQICPTDYEVLKERARDGRCEFGTTVFVEERSPKSVATRMTAFVAKERIKAIFKGYQHWHHKDGDARSYYQGA